MRTSDLIQVSEGCHEIPAAGGMNVPARIFAGRALLEEMDEKVREQITNVARLPGIVKAACAMPDAHWGYGFPIGGVAAFDPAEGGVISMGGIGYDISCGVRTLRTGLSEEEVAPRLEKVATTLFERVPAGVGSEGKIRLDRKGLDRVLLGGGRWAVEQGWGEPDELEFVEERGCMGGADPGAVSDTAKSRGLNQIGTLGSGNHYLELQVVEEVFDPAAASAFGIAPGEVLLSLHCGSRALGHQVATDYQRELAKASKRLALALPDRELVCAPIDSPEGRRYFGAMVAAVNGALANRQVIAALAARAFREVFPQARVRILYDVSHNTCKVEEHSVDGGRRRRLWVHRKGATRAFGPGHPDLPASYRDVGQPVLVGGTMGTASYVLAGTAASAGLAFASACHGAGRAMSRTEALRNWRGERVERELAARGIVIKGHSLRGLAEEAPGAYKDIRAVAEATERAGLARKVARLRPIGCVKG
ncbi:MAG TPA: RtcB family protein [Planctomycetota bacterium]|jgi:tRNA-splicing ligase RtcB|nr:RtcB family protein [Planctomycetota bacterium]